MTDNTTECRLQQLEEKVRRMENLRAKERKDNSTLGAVAKAAVYHVASAYAVAVATSKIASVLRERMLGVNP